jgi:signal recognition particle subunit SRP54
MTPLERSNPDILNASRKNRIARGSGTSLQQVNQLLKQFEQMKKMMKTVNRMGGSGRGLVSMSPRGRN